MKFKPNTFVTYTPYNRECIVVGKSKGPYKSKGTYIVKVIDTGEVVEVHKSELTKVDNQAGALVRALNAEEAWGLPCRVYMYRGQEVTSFKEVGGMVVVWAREVGACLTVAEVFEVIDRYTYEPSLI